MIDAFMSGVLTTLEPMNLLFMAVGVFMGIIFGALPGLTATMGLALLVPFTFTMPPAEGLIMLGGIYIGAMYGDAIPAILINTPGTPSAIATTFDGYPLAKKGMAQHALVAGGFSTALGTGLAGLLLLVAAPPLAQASLKFGPPEYFWLGIFGLTIIASLSTGSMLKGFLSGALGLLLSTVGMAPLGGDVRLTFGFPGLQAGIELVVALIGFFCLPEILTVIGQRKAAYAVKKVKPNMRAVGEVFLFMLRHPILVLRSAAIGAFVGFTPGAGGNIASVVAYNEACRFDRHPEEFGKGTLKGIVASETANSAVAPGSLIPMLTLGIPGSPPAAVILGALLLHGMRPGAELFTTYADVTYAFMVSLMIAAVFVAVVGTFGSFLFARIIDIPSRYLAPAVVFMTVLGAYSIRNNMLDVWIMFSFGVIGYVFEKLRFPSAPVVLGMILGPFVEEGYVQSTLAGRASGSILEYMIFRPISLVLIALCVISILWPFYASWRAKHRPSGPCKLEVQNDPS